MTAARAAKVEIEATMAASLTSVTTAAAEICSNNSNNICNSS
jgi:hypothetical protein